MSNILSLRNAAKSYQQAGEDLQVLKDSSFDIKAGEIVALVGPSGSGKSTLLHIAGLLDTPTSGQVLMNDRDISQCNDTQRTQIRRHMMGFVYQFHYLQPEFSALENIVIPQMIAGSNKKNAEKRARDLLSSMGLEHRLDHRPARLSGGEQQRVAIARALANDPKLLIADEPTGNLDSNTEAGIIDLLKKLHKERNLTLLVATHDDIVAAEAQRVERLVDGRITD